MTCKHCGCIISSKKAIFCSDVCRREWWRLNQDKLLQHDLVCEQCKQVFKSNKKRQRFCSVKCRNIANANKKEALFLSYEEHVVWSCGAGVDSVAIAVLICSGRLPLPDIAVMSDNGYDAEYTWEYVNEILKPNLEKVDVSLNIVDTKDVTILITTDGYVSIPMFVDTNDGPTKYRTHCSNSFKTYPILQWLKKQGVKRCINWIGVAADESRRAKPSKLKWVKYKYPLVDLNLSRSDCKRLIRSYGWPVPERSSCIMCPNKTDDDWVTLKRLSPLDFARAVEIEREIRETNPTLYLHKSMKTLDYVEFRGGGFDL